MLKFYSGIVYEFIKCIWTKTQRHDFEVLCYDYLKNYKFYYSRINKYDKTPFRMILNHNQWLDVQRL